MALYIYNQDTNEIAVVIDGYVSNEQAEDKASEFNFDQDLFAWSYTKGVDLFETEDTEYFNFDGDRILE